MASVATCPCCGFDLYALKDFALGPLSVKDGAIIRWHGREVNLRPSARLMLLALVKADGAPVSRGILAEVGGYEGDNPHPIVAVWLHHIIHAFRDIDSDFDAIQNVWGVGLRWRTEQDHLLAA